MLLHPPLFLAAVLAGLLQSTWGQSPAQSPAPSRPDNITEIMEKAGRYSLMVRLLGTTRVGEQTNTQLNNSDQGFTVLAPTDEAFSGLKAGTLNQLNDQEKVDLVQYHIIPTFLTMENFDTISNPVHTQAGSSDAGKFPLNVSSSGNQVNISTGIVVATIGGTIYTDNQLAIYQIDRVLLPGGIFETQAPAPAPVPTQKKPKKPSAKSDTGDDPMQENIPVAGSFHQCPVAVLLATAMCSTAFLL